MNDPEQFIWICRWQDFQHYAPERDRGPAWIKLHTPQHDDDRYMELSAVQRAVLHDVRIAFARARHKLSRDTRRLSQRIGYRVTSVQLETLNHAGFIEFCSREVLEQRLEDLYASRARARAREKPEPEPEKEKEEDQASTSTEAAIRTPRPADPTPAEDFTPPRLNNGLPFHQQLELAKLLDWIGNDRDDRTGAVIRRLWQDAPPEARQAVEHSMTTATPRHRARWLVTAIKAETARARTQRAATTPA